MNITFSTDMFTGYTSSELMAPGLSHSPLLRRGIDARYEGLRREYAFRWALINSLLFLIFAYDLWGACPGHMSALHALQLCACGVLLVSAARHGWQLRRSGAPSTAISAAQRRLLGLSSNALESSFRIVENSSPQSSAGGGGSSDAGSEADSTQPLSLSVSRSWSGDSPRASPPPAPHALPDQFIADDDSLSDYLKRVERRGAAAGGGGPAAAAAAAGGARSPPRYQLASASPPPRAESEEGGEADPLLLYRLDIDPHQMTQYNLNMRLWLQTTVLEPLAKELRQAPAHPLHDVQPGEVSVERLRGAAAALGAAGWRLRALLPYLQPFADQRYAVRRIQELATGGYLSRFRWDGGGGGWDDSKPTDAELVLHLFATYMDSQWPWSEEGPAGFTSRHVSAAPGPPPRGLRALAMHRASTRPPHYLLLLQRDLLEVCRGRSNLLHTMLCWVAAAAAGRGPTVLPSHLNLHWVVGRR